MTAEAWLLRREPAPPAALAERLRAALARDGVAGESPSPELFLGAGERLVAELLRDGCATRGNALDLLAADALVTYAFEAASAEPERLDARAQHAMQRIAALAGDGPA